MMANERKLTLRLPSNKTAGPTVFNAQYDLKTNYSGHWHSKKLPELAHLPRKANDDLEGMIGRRFGRLRVVGLMPPRSTGGPARWAVRCGCGEYEWRTAKAIRNPANKFDKCQKCRAEWGKKAAPLEGL